MTFARSLLVSGVLLLTACQAPAIAPSPTAPATAHDGPVMVVLADGDVSLPALRERDGLTLEAPVNAPLSLPITFARGVEEQVSWEGTGQGAARLINEHGQLVYQVKEGEPAKTVTVPPGHYTFTLTPDASQPPSPMLMTAVPQATGVAQVRTLVDLAEVEGQAMAARGPGGTCDALLGMLRKLGDLERGIQLPRQHARYHTYLDHMDVFALGREYVETRAQVRGFYGAFGDVIRGECADMSKHEPSAVSGALPWFAPYLYTYYMKNF